MTPPEHSEATNTPDGASAPAQAGSSAPAQADPSAPAQAGPSAPAQAGASAPAQAGPSAPAQVGPAAVPVRYERMGAAAVITIDRQHRRNAVDGPTAAALHEAYLRFESEDDARVLVLTGAGGISFCAGADLKEQESFRGRLMSAEGPMGFTRLTPSKPTIAAISGFCLAGGLELALWCDLRIATEGSVFGCPERRWGVPLIDGGTQRLPRIVGLGRALDLILTGRLLEAEEALGMGLVTEIVPPGGHLKRALALAEGLAGFPQRTMLADRRAAIEGVSMGLSEGLAMEAAHGPEVFEDGARGAARFAAGEGRGGAGAGA